jgi:hypothetical protein
MSAFIQPLYSTYMRRRKESPYYDRVTIEDLIPEEIVTLHSLSENWIPSRRSVLTKEGGYWPIILTRLHFTFEISTEDIGLATDKAMDEYLYFTNKNYDLIYQPQPKVEIEMLDVFLKNLFRQSKDDYYYYVLHYGKSSSVGANFQHPLELFLNQISNEYRDILEQLSKAGLIKDPYYPKNQEPILYMGTTPKRFSELTASGEEKLQSIRQIIQGERPSTIETLTKEFNRSLLELYAEFISRITQKTI